MNGNAAETPLANVPSFPALEARAYLLQDFHSGRVLMEKNSAERLEPASLTKIMTAYIVFQTLKAGRIQLVDKVKVSEKAWRMGGSRMYLDVNSEVPVEQLLKGMIIQSGNDASVALAEHIAGNEDAFVNLMNEQVKQWKLANTHYINATGLPDKQHYSSARDLAWVARALIRDFPDYYHWYSEQQFTYNNITQPNRNPLLSWDKSVDGIKTGFTDGAGYCLIASAKRGDMRLIALVLGESSSKLRSEEVKKMLTYGFQSFETYLLYQADQELNTEKAWYGSPSQLRLGLDTPLYVTIPKNQYEQLKATIRVNKPLVAPIHKGDSCGKLTITLVDNVVAERPLIALHEVQKGHFLRRFVDHLWLKFH